MDQVLVLDVILHSVVGFARQGCTPPNAASHNQHLAQKIYTNFILRWQYVALYTLHS